MVEVIDEAGIDPAPWGDLPPNGSLEAHLVGSEVLPVRIRRLAPDPVESPRISGDLEVPGDKKRPVRQVDLGLGRDHVLFVLRIVRDKRDGRWPGLGRGPLRPERPNPSGPAGPARFRRIEDDRHEDQGARLAGRRGLLALLCGKEKGQAEKDECEAGT